MPRVIIAALSTVVGLAFSPHMKEAHAQPPFSKPPSSAPRPTFKADLIAVFDSNTRIVVGRATMRMNGNPASAIARPIVNDTYCSGLQVGERREIQVRPLWYGVRNASQKTGNGNELIGHAANFVVRFNYTSNSNGLIAEQTVSQAVDGLSPGQQSLYQFTHPLRPTSFIAEYYEEPAAVLPPSAATPPPPPGSNGVMVQPRPPRPIIVKRYCVASVPFVDGAMSVTADPSSAVPDRNPTNNQIIVR
jgi:hypothetical protein